MAERFINELLHKPQKRVSNAHQFVITACVLTLAFFGGYYSGKPDVADSVEVIKPTIDVERKSDNDSNGLASFEDDLMAILARNRKRSVDERNRATRDRINSIRGGTHDVTEGETD